MHTITIIPLDLSELATVIAFAWQVSLTLGPTNLDFLFLNAAISDPAGQPGAVGPHGSKWSNTYIVNHLCKFGGVDAHVSGFPINLVPPAQHYLVHLLLPTLISSNTHIIFTSSASFREVDDPRVFERDLLAGSGTPGRKLYSETKFTHLLGAHWWRRELHKRKTGCTVVAVSPGLVPRTGIGKGMGMDFTGWDGARELHEGAASIIAAFHREDFPEDPDLVFLTSWGEWWGRDVLEKTLDKELQDRWCPGREEIEREFALNGRF